MVMQVQDSAGEIAEAIKAQTPEEPKEEAKSSGTDDAKETQKEDEDETPEWVTKLGITPDQHKGLTEVIKRSVDRKHRQMKEAEEFAKSQYEERKLAEERADKAQRELEETRKAVEPPKKEAEEPKREAFPDDKAYQDALIDWRVDQKFRQREAEDAKAREKARQDSIMAAASERIAAARELVPDFDEVVGAADDIIPSHIAAYMQESEMFAELGYHFAQHPEDLRKLGEMPARTYADLARVGVALGKIESNIQPFSKEKAPNASKASTNGHGPSSDTGTVPSQPRAAAPVIQPIGAGSSSQVEKPASRRDYAEERAHFTKTHNPNLLKRARH